MLHKMSLPPPVYGDIRRYHRITDEEKARIKAEYNKAPWGKKGAVATRLAVEIGCSREWVIKVALSDAP